MNMSQHFKRNRYWRGVLRIFSRTSVVAACFTTVIQSALGTAFAAQPATPKAEVRPAGFNFGYLPQKAKVSTSFSLHNVGGAPLSVKKIDPGCSCTGTSSIDKPLSPGDSAVVTVTFNSGRYLHKVRKTTTVNTNDPDNQSSQFKLSAYVVEEDEPTGSIELTPRKIVWQQSKEGALKVIDTVVVRSRYSGDAVVRIERVSHPSLIAVKLPGKLQPNDQQRLIVTPGAGVRLPEGVEGLCITLSFSGKDTTTITIPIETKRD